MQDDVGHLVLEQLLEVGGRAVGAVLGDEDLPGRRMGDARDPLRHARRLGDATGVGDEDDLDVVGDVTGERLLDLRPPQRRGLDETFGLVGQLRLPPQVHLADRRAFGGAGGVPAGGLALGGLSVRGPDAQP